MRRIDVVDFASSTMAANASDMRLCAGALDDSAPNAMRANFSVQSGWPQMGLLVVIMRSFRTVTWYPLKMFRFGQ